MLQEITAIGDIGVIAEGVACELPDNAFTDANNFRFGGGYAERISGNTENLAAPAVIPYWLSYFYSTQSYWIYASNLKIYVSDGVTNTNITRQTASVDVNYTASVGNVWTGGILGGIAIVNNPNDDPQFWAGNPATKCAAVTAWPATTKCNAMRVFKNYLIALNVNKAGTQYQHMVKWSSAANPGALPVSWDPTDATKDAGENDLSDSQSYIVDGLQLGEVFIVYKQRSYYLMEYVGAPYIFRFKKLYEGQGALARNCVCETPLGHVVLGQGDVYLHNADKPKSIVTDRVRSKLFSEIDTSYYQNSFVFCNSKKNEVWICYPKNGSQFCNKVLIWNWVQDTLTFRDGQNFTCASVCEVPALSSWTSDADAWDSDTSTWDASDSTPGEQSCIVGSSNTKLYLIDQKTLFDGVTITGYVERKGLTFGQKSKSKLVKGIRIHADGADGTTITVLLGSAPSESGNVTWGAAVTYTLGQKNLACSSVSGRFIAYRITASNPLKLRTIEFDYQIKSGY